MKSVMNHNFSQIPTVQIPRSTFDRSHGVKTTFPVDYLIPIIADECVPGDTFNLRASIFARLATPITPFMDNLKLETFFFFVPNRLIWDNWEKFNGAQDNPGDSTDFLIPKLTTPAGGHLEQSLSDYFGIPTKIDDVDPNVLHYRAYNLIYNEWFKDQNLINNLSVPKTNGPDDDSLYGVQKRAKKHDYFTSCLPWPQKGDSVSIPVGGVTPVYGTGKTLGLTDGTDFAGLMGSGAVIGNVQNETSLYDVNVGTSETGGGELSSEIGIGVTSDGTKSGMEVDLSNTTAITINALRLAFQTQAMLEKDARGGTRYIEIIKSHFGVTSPDSRLQRPEYLGGGSISININPVQQTSNTVSSGADASPQGNLAAFGTAAGKGGGFNKSFVEHGVIIGLANVSADLTYQQGLNKMWSRQTRFDFYWPSFAHLGEQAVLNKEIYFNNDANDNLTFGYQERYAEYRYKPSTITGIFRSNATGSLDVWHLSQNFTALPALNATFINSTTPIDRVLAVPSEPDILFDCYFEYKCARPMPVYSVPGKTDAF